MLTAAVGNLLVRIILAVVFAEATQRACQRHDNELRIVCEDCGNRNMQAAEEVRWYVPVVRAVRHPVQ